jgi:hypothetical protein
MSSAVASYGLTFKWNGNLLAEVTNVEGPGIKFDTIDVTHYASPEAFKEFIAGFGDGGEVTLECNFIPSDTAGQVAFITDAKAKTVREVIITTPAGTTWTFDALVTSLEFKEPLEEQLGFTATLKVSGNPTLGITLSTGMSAMTGIEENTGAALTFNPTFAIAKFAYAVAVNTASDWIKLTPTAATHTIVVSNGTDEQIVSSGNQSGEIALGVAGTLTTVTVTVQESGKVAKVYTIYVSRP